MATDVVTRAEALSKGLVRYFTGLPCKHSHIAERQTSNGVCVSCRYDIEKRSNKKHPDKVREKRRLQAQRHRRDNPKRIARNKKNWELRNPDKRRAVQSKCRAAKPELYRGHEKKWRVANSEKIAKKNRAYKTANAERLSPIAVARTLQWRKENPEKVRENARKGSHTRRARKHHAGGSYTNAQINLLLEKQKWKCAGHNCGASLRDGKELDHIKPLARKGSNDITNLQWLCVPCNRKKRDKDPVDWARENGRLL